MVMPSGEIDIDRLIKFVRENPPLWNRRDKRYHCRGLRGRLWVKAAHELGISAEAAKKRWQGLRDVFRKEYRKYGMGRNDEVPNSVWVHYNDMYFLINTLEPMKLQGDISSLETSSPCPITDCKEELYFYDEPLTDDEPQPSENCSQPPVEFRNMEFSNSQSNSRKSKLTDCNDYFLENEEKLSSGSRTSNMKEESDRQFLLSLQPFFQRFSLPQTLMVRQKLLQVLIDEQQNG